MFQKFDCNKIFSKESEIDVYLIDWHNSFSKSHDAFEAICPISWKQLTKIVPEIYPEERTSIFIASSIEIESIGFALFTAFDYTRVVFALKRSKDALIHRL